MLRENDLPVSYEYMTNSNVRENTATEPGTNVLVVFPEC